jgi:WASH complex subunit strumpellin
VPYKAARTALANTTAAASTRTLHVQCLERVASGRKMLQDHLTEGVLTDEYVLDNTQHLLHCVRECNIAVRWLMLHRRARTKKIGDGGDRSREAEQLLLLLMNTGQLEYLLRQKFTSLLEAKEAMWTESKQQVLTTPRHLHVHRHPAQRLRAHLAGGGAAVRAGRVLLGREGAHSR